MWLSPYKGSTSSLARTVVESQAFIVRCGFLYIHSAKAMTGSPLHAKENCNRHFWAGPESISPAMRRGDNQIQGTRRTQPVNLRLGFASDEYGYLINSGLPTPGSSAFSLDPQIKRECIWHRPVLRPSTMLVDRQGPLVRIRGEDESWNVVTDRLSAFDSMMTHVSVRETRQKC